MWQIGNDAWNNGYYGPDHAAEFDLRAGPIPSAKDAGKRQGNARIGPTAYAEGFLAFAKAMKAVDPKILVGASFTTPTTNVSWMHASSIGTSSASDLTGQSASAISWGGDWDSDLLKAACGEIDFGALSLVESPTLPPDYKVLDEEALLQSLGKDYNGIVTDLLERFRKDCPAGHTPRLAFTNFGASAQTIPHPGVVALFAADGAATLIETGSVSIDWTSYHNSLFIGEGNKPGPAYFGYQMVHILANQPGDAFVQCQIELKSAGGARQPSAGMAATDCCWSTRIPGSRRRLRCIISGILPAQRGFRFDYGEEAAGPARALAACRLTISAPALRWRSRLHGDSDPDFQGAVRESKVPFLRSSSGCFRALRNLRLNRIFCRALVFYFPNCFTKKSAIRWLASMDFGKPLVIPEGVGQSVEDDQAGVDSGVR